MVEEERGNDAVALARLELLSSTAMLKKVMDRKGGTRDSRKITSTTSSLNDLATSVSHGVTTTILAPRPASPDQESIGRGESPSVHSNVDSARDAPPQTQGSHTIAPLGYHYFTYNPTSAGNLYPRGTPLPGYVPGRHGEVYYLENSNIVTLPPPRTIPSHHVTAGSRQAFPSVKENVPPHAFRPTSLYSQLSVQDHSLDNAADRPHFTSPRVTPEHIPRTVTEESGDPCHPSYDALARENLQLREQLKEKDIVVSSLQQRVNYLEKQISELRQLPTGKISHIPIE